jgi:hypothetical protein
MSARRGQVTVFRVSAPLTLDEFPGPRGLPLVGNILDIDSANPIEGFVRMAGEYGPEIASISPRHYAAVSYTVDVPAVPVAVEARIRASAWPGSSNGASPCWTDGPSVQARLTDGPSVEGAPTVHPAVRSAGKGRVLGIGGGVAGRAPHKINECGPRSPYTGLPNHDR